MKSIYFKAIFQYGEVYGVEEDIIGNKKGWIRKLGKYIKVMSLPKEEEWVIDPYQVTYKYYPNAPRVISFRRRKAIKDNLPKKHKNLYRIARKLNKSIFIDKYKEVESNIRLRGYKDLEHFWRVCKYSHYHKVPEPIKKQKTLDQYNM